MLNSGFCLITHNNISHFLVTTSAVLLLATAHTLGQASITVDKTKALIGDEIALTLQINAPEGSTWENQDVEPADTVAAIDVLRTGDTQEKKGGGYTQYLKSWTISAYDTGIVRIPPVPVILSGPQGIDTQFTNDIPLMISGVVDSLGFAPIKPIVREPAKFSDYLPYILGVVGLILLILVAIWIRRRKPKDHEIVEIRDEKPAHVIALEQLDALEREKLWQQGLVKEYHSRLSLIVRAYLERRYGIRAVESTTGEILTQLRSHALPEGMLDEVRDVMQAEDLIKFAKAEPPVDIHAQYLEFARTLILHTRHIPEPEQAND